MKIRNKTTGEVVDLCEGFLGGVGCGEYIVVKPTACLNKEYRYDSWEEFVSEWEAYQEPKEHWWIDSLGGVCCSNREDVSESQRDIGNYFETEEEAEKALRKLKVWQRLQDEGFKFTGWKERTDVCVGGHITIDAYLPSAYYEGECLDFLFRGEE